MNNEEWAASWAKLTRTDYYALVEREARKVLTDTLIDTNGLAELMFPMLSQRGPGIDARKALVHCLLKLAKGSMSDCASKDMTSEPRLWYGKPVRPWQWKAGTATRRERCPCCAGKGWRGEADICQGEIKPVELQTIA